MVDEERGSSRRCGGLWSSKDYYSSAVIGLGFVREMRHIYVNEKLAKPFIDISDFISFYTPLDFVTMMIIVCPRSLF